MPFKINEVKHPTEKKLLELEATLDRTGMRHKEDAAKVNVGRRGL